MGGSTGMKAMPTNPERRFGFLLFVFYFFSVTPNCIHGDFFYICVFLLLLFSSTSISLTPSHLISLVSAVFLSFVRKATNALLRYLRSGLRRVFLRACSLARSFVL